MDKLLVVDGYNYIFNSLDGEKISNKKLGFLRERLIGYLEQYGGLTGLDIIVVFDSSDKSQARDEYRARNLKVIYSGRDSADSVIEKIVASSYKDRQIFVVTSDYLQQKTVMKKNIYRKSAREFNQELSKVVEDMREDIKKVNIKKTSGFYSLENRLGLLSRQSLKRFTGR